MARQLWQGFLDRHEAVWQFIRAHDEAFWADLTDVSEELRRLRYPGGRARIFEIRTREAGIQTGTTARETATQTDSPGGDALAESRGRRAGTPSSDEGSVILVEEPFRRRRVARAPYRPNPSPSTTRELLY